LRQSRHHIIQLGLDELVQKHIQQLIEQTANLQVDQWTPDKRQRVAAEVKTLFNVVAQIAQKADSNFDSGPG
jgi:hypothetical protein